MKKIKRALISVSDKNNLINLLKVMIFCPFSRSLISIIIVQEVPEIPTLWNPSRLYSLSAGCQGATLKLMCLVPNWNASNMLKISRCPMPSPRLCGTTATPNSGVASSTKLQECSEIVQYRYQTAPNRNPFFCHSNNSYIIRVTPVLQQFFQGWICPEFFRSWMVLLKIPTDGQIEHLVQEG